MRSLMICSKNGDSLHLNESEKINSGRYILEGPVATLDKINRNQRIYPKEEYLKHLEYLRDDLRHPEKGWILGEPGHPADRFETDIKEASHRILDLWYKPETNQVMGKIELLDTPNGRLLKGLVDEGMPLCISSRASGTVGKDNIVDIQQIFTYDVVIKPGFEDAVLHRVNESAEAPVYSDTAKDFCRNMISNESKSIAAQMGLDESYSILDSKVAPEIRKEAQNIKINTLNENNIEDMTKPITEAVNPDATVGKPLEIKGSTNMFDPSKIVQSTSTNEDDKEEEKTDDTASFGATDDKDTNDVNSETKEDDIKVIDVRAEFDDDIVKDVEPVYSDDEEKEDDSEKSDDSDDSDEKSDDEKEDDVDECGDGDASECDKNDKECDKDDKELEKDLNETKDKKEKLEKSKKELTGKLDKLIAGIKSKSAKNESLVAKFPHAGLMDQNNYRKFAALDEKQQIKVSNWLVENMIYSPDAINKLWEGALTETVNDAPIWLKNASDEYKGLYESASELERKNLEICAKYCVFESQRDIDNFWENSGLRQRKETEMMNEAYINNMPRIQEQTVSENLPYTTDFIEMIGNAACEYNKSW